MRLFHRTSVVILTLLTCGASSVYAQTPPTTGGRQLRMFSRTEMLSPINLATQPAVWFDASDSSTITLSGTSVTQWNDKSGNNRNATPPAVNLRPVYGQFQARPVIRFGETGDFKDRLDASLSLTINTITVFVVGSKTDFGQATNRYSRLVGFWNPSNDYGTTNSWIPAWVSRDVSANPTPPPAVGTYRNGVSLTGQSITGYGVPLLVASRLNGITTTLWLNGTATQNTTGSSLALSSATISLGGTNDGSDSELNGWIAEVLVYTSALTDADCQRIEGYLAWKWGLQANLAVGHPFRNTPPLAATLTNTNLTLEIPASTTSYSLNLTSTQPTLNAVAYQDGEQTPPLLRWTNGSVSNGDVFRMSDDNPPVPGWYARSSGLWYTQGGNPAAGGTYTSSGDLGAAPSGGSSWLGTVDANDLNLVTGNVQRSLISSDGTLSHASAVFINPVGTNLVSLTSSGSFPASVRNLFLRSPNLATLNTFPHSIGTLNPDSNTVIGAQTVTSTTYPLRSIGNTVLGARALQTGLFAGRGGATLANMRLVTGINNTLVGNSVVTVMASGGNATFVGATVGQFANYTMGDVAIGNLAAASFTVTAANMQDVVSAGAGNPSQIAPSTVVGFGALRGFTNASRPHHVIIGSDALGRAAAWSGAREVVAIGSSVGSNLNAPTSSTFYLSNRATGNFLMLGGLEFPRLQVNAPADIYNIPTGARNPNTVDAILMVNAVANEDNDESVDPTNDPRDEVATLSTTTPTVLSPTNADPGLRLTVQEPLPSRADMADAVLNGIATANFGTNTLTDVTKAWTPGQWVGYRVIATSDGGVNVQQREISANTATQLTVTPNWTTAYTTAGAGVRYSILPSIMDTERAGAGSTSMTQTMTQIDFNGNVHFRPYGTAAGASEAFGEVAEIRFYDRASFAGGTITANQAIGTAAFTDNTKAWFPDAYRNAIVRIVAGPGEGQTRRITTHGSSTGTVNSNWTTALVAGQSRYEIEIVAETGVATVVAPVNSVTLTDGSKDWVAENLNFAGAELRIVGGTGRGQIRTVISNTANVVTVNAGWSTALDATTIYQISNYFPRYIGFRAANNLTQYNGVAFNPFMKLPPPPGAGRLVLQVASTDGGGTLAWSTNVGVMAFDQTWDNRAAEIGTSIDDTPLYGWPTTGYAFGSTGAAEQSMIFGTKLNLTGPPTEPIGSLAPRADFITGFGYGLMTGLDDVADAGNNSVGLGHHSMRSLTSGADNVAIGVSALDRVSTGSQNVGIGYGSLESITGGTGFVAIGASALSNAIATVPSTAIGHSALLSLTTGVRNVAVGEGALRMATTINDVVAIGTSAASSLLTGDRNVIVGSNAAIVLTSGSDLVLMGANITPNLTAGQRLIAIGARALDNAVNLNDQIAIGEGALRNLTTSASGFNIAIGPSAMGNVTSSSLNIGIGQEALLNVGSSGTDNVAIGARALVNNIEGSRNYALGSSAGTNLLSGNDNHLYGTNAARSLTVGSRNFAIGPNSLASLVNQDDNIAIGENALFSLTNGTNNIGIGADAAFSLVNGLNNIAIGRESLRQMTTGQDNIMLGSSSGRAIVTGDENIAIGSEAMRLSTGTNRNIGIGLRAMLRAGSGEHNIALGVDALTFSTTGANNIAIGTSAGFAVTSGDQNTIIGQQALPSSFSGSRNMIIGSLAAPALRSGDENIAIGQSVITVMTSGSSHIAIGDRALSALANGVTSTNLIIVGNSAGSTLTSGSNNIGVGVTSLGSGGSDNIAVGLDAMRGSTSPQMSIALGVRAMQTITTGARNIAAGIDAMNGGLTTGNQNIAIGSSAGTLLTSGADNVALGDRALGGATSASLNIAIGQQAAPALSLSTNNIAVGQFAMLAATSAGSMIAIGQRALGALVTGTATAAHIAIGSSAGSRFIAGTRNIAIGHLAYSGTGGGTNAIAIGFEAMLGAVGTSRSIAIGQNALRNVSSGDNNVAIGSNAMLGVSGTPLTGTLNVAIGSSAGTAIRGGAASNTLIGTNAGGAITTGQNNTAIGSNALRVQTMNGNVAIGRDAMSNAGLTTAANNTAVGHRAAIGITGSENVAMGHSAMVNATATSSNVALGAWTLVSLTGGSSNVAIGTSAGRAVTAGVSNIAIGENAMMGAISTGASNIMIGHSAGSALATTASRNIGMGPGVMRSLTSASDVIAVGFEALRSTTSLSAPSIAIGNETMVAVVASTGSNIAIGNQALNAVTTSSENLAVGEGALFSLSTGNGRNIAIGQNAMRSGTDASNSIAIGRDALVNARGSANIALGMSALRTTDATTAVDNIAIGASALELATNPRRNIAVGYQAAYNLLDGVGNVAVGQMALMNSTTAADNNIAVGTSALLANTTGTENVAIGNLAMSSATTGAMSTTVALGTRALEGMTEGSANTVIGSQALSSATVLGSSGGGNVALGYQAGKRALGTVDGRLFIANSETKALLYGEFGTGRVATNADMPADGSLPTLNAAMQVNSSDPAAPGAIVRLAADPIEAAMVIENASGTMLFEINSAGELSKTANGNYTWPDGPPAEYAAGVAVGKGVLTSSSLPSPTLSWTQMTLPTVLVENVNFPDVDPNSSQDIVIVTDIPGAAVGDVVGLGVPADCGLLPLVTFHAWVSAADEVTIRINNLSDDLLNPPDDQEFKIIVIK